MGAHIGNRAKRRRNRRAKLWAWKAALRRLYAHCNQYASALDMPNPRSVWGPTYKCPDSRYHTTGAQAHLYGGACPKPHIPSWGQLVAEAIERDLVARDVAKHDAWMAHARMPAGAPATDVIVAMWPSNEKE